MSRFLYRADKPHVLVDALLATLMYARKHSDNFRFGPIKLRDLVRDGLLIEGKDTEGITTVLNKVPGLALVEY